MYNFNGTRLASVNCVAKSHYIFTSVYDLGILIQVKATLSGPKRKFKRVISIRYSSAIC